MIQLESIEHDYIKSLKSQPYSHMQLVQKGKCCTWNLRSIGSILIGGNILFRTLFSRNKASEVNRSLLALLLFLCI